MCFVVTILYKTLRWLTRSPVSALPSTLDQPNDDYHKFYTGHNGGHHITLGMYRQSVCVCRDCSHLPAILSNRSFHFTVHWCSSWCQFLTLHFILYGSHLHLIHSCWHIVLLILVLSPCHIGEGCVGHKNIPADSNQGQKSKLLLRFIQGDDF